MERIVESPVILALNDIITPKNKQNKKNYSKRKMKKRREIAKVHRL